MTPLWIVMLGGLLGSSHCVGMCGGFAAIVGLRTKTLLANLQSQLLYSAGRLMSYSTLGAVAGFAGQRISSGLPKIVNVPAILCLVAGAFLVREGLLATGLLRRRVTGASATGCLMGPLFSTILKAPGARNTFVAGIATGLLPCGLVYAFVSLAASTGDLVEGLKTMLAFGLGTVPLMVLTGCGTALLSWTARQKVWRVAAWSVVFTGGLTLVRGIAFLQFGSEPETVSCPFCASKPSSTQARQGSSTTTYQVTSPATADFQLFLPK